MKKSKEKQRELNEFVRLTINFLFLSFFGSEGVRAFA